MLTDNLEKATFIQTQIRETVKQEAAGITIRSATITCRCGWERSALLMYKCLYCQEWFCTICAEQHFGKTIKEYHEEKTQTQERK